LPETPRKVIEFIGGSDLAGLGSVGPSKCLKMAYLTPRLSFFSDPDAVSYARHVAKSFDADVVNMGVGGSGLIANQAGKSAAAGLKKVAEVHVGAPAAAVYDHKLCFNWGEDPAKGNVAKYTSDNVPNADLVVVWIGQNDLLGGHIDPEDVAKGSEKYTELLGKVRELRPDTPVLCIYPESVTHASHPHARAALEFMGSPKGYGPTSAYARQKAISGEESAIKAWAMAAAKALGGEGSKVYVRGVDMQPFFDPKTDYGAFCEIGFNAQKKWARGIVPHVEAIMKWDGNLAQQAGELKTKSYSISSLQPLRLFAFAPLGSPSK